MAKTRTARSLAPSGSSVTQTGRRHTTRGAGRPALAAASVITGTMWSRTVAGPVIHSTVPSACGTGQPQHLGAERGDHDRDPAGRRGGQPDVRPHGGPGERGRLPVQQRQQHREVLLHVQDRLAEVVAVHVLDHDLVGQPDAEHQAAATAAAQRSGPAGPARPGAAGRWAPRRCRPRCRAHLAARDRQRGQRVHPEDVAHPGGGEALVGGALQFLAQRRHRARAGRVLQWNTDAHLPASRAGGLDGSIVPVAAGGRGDGQPRARHVTAGEAGWAQLVWYRGGVGPPRPRINTACRPSNA